MLLKYRQSALLLSLVVELLYSSQVLAGPKIELKPELKPELTPVLKPVLKSALTTTNQSQHTNERNVISLAEAVARAQYNDPWLQGNELQQHAIMAKSIAAATLPDPTVSIGLVNMPVDSWDFSQEAMTQLKIGVSQQLARGDTLTLKKSQLQLQASQYPLMRIDRRAKVTSLITQLWLDAYLAQKTIKLIHKDKALFEQMVDIAKASYSSTAGKTRQQDVIRAQLELLQLDDRLTVELQTFETTMAQLNEWLPQVDRSANVNSSVNNYRFGDSARQYYRVSEPLPKLTLTAAKLLKQGHYSANDVAHKISTHPALQAIEVNYNASAQNIAIAKEQYQPKWGVNASYAFRDDAASNSSSMNANNRADFFSVGVTFDVPLFTDNKQDKNVEASQAESAAIKTEKLLLLRAMMANIDKERLQLQRLSERQALYNKHLLRQTHDQAEASLTAYTNDDGDFAEVVRARIAELNAQISSLKIDIEALKTVARLNYYFVDSSPDTSSANKRGHINKAFGE
ncbi:MAG: TolC family protein [Thalassotalea sp.]